MISVTTKLVFALLAVAHTGGHGQKIEGRGPNGGRLAPVVLASEAELGAKAKTQAVAEWVKEGDSLRVVFWDLARTQSLAVKTGNFKWILLGEKLPKPEVISAWTELRSPSLALADSVEIILPALGALAQKQVAVIDLAAPDK